MVLDISKAFDRVWHASLPHKVKFYGVSGQIFGLTLSFLSKRWLRVVLDAKFLQAYLVKGTVMETEKALINNRLRVLKLS